MKEYEEKFEIVGERGSYSKTDKDATFMRMKEDAMNNGQTKPGYNVQIATENQFITNFGLNDQGTMIPLGQHLEFVKQIKEKSELGYESTKSVYRAKDCSRCPLRSMCYKGKCNARIIEVNHRNNELRAMARELLTSDEGLMHRSRRPIEPEAVFGQIKYDNHFKRFSYRGKRLVNAEFAAIAVAHNIRKMIAKGYCVCSEVTVG